jgi:hypothetical protein
MPKGTVVPPVPLKKPVAVIKPIPPIPPLKPGSKPVKKLGAKGLPLNRSVAAPLERIALYLDRVRRDLEAGDRSQALSDAAKLPEIVRRLWVYLADAEGYSCTEAQVRLAAGGDN